MKKKDNHKQQVCQSWDKLYTKFSQLNHIKDNIICPSCKSYNFIPSSIDLQDLNDIKFKCLDCDESFNFEELVKSIYKDEEYISITDGGKRIIWDCPECGTETFISTLGLCLACEKELQYTQCERCGENLSPEEQEYGGLCSYCNHQYEKVMDE